MADCECKAVIWSYHQGVPKVYNSRKFEAWFSHDRSVDWLISKTTSAWYKAGKNLYSTAMLPTSAKTPWANQLVTQYIGERCPTVSLSVPPSHHRTTKRSQKSDKTESVEVYLHAWHSVIQCIYSLSPLKELSDLLVEWLYRTLFAACWQHPVALRMAQRSCCGILAWTSSVRRFSAASMRCTCQSQLWVSDRATKELPG